MTGKRKIKLRLVMHGKWRDASDGDGKVCSICGEDYCDIVRGCNVNEWLFCPRCGAKMKTGWRKKNNYE